MEGGEASEGLEKRGTRDPEVPRHAWSLGSQQRFLREGVPGAGLGFETSHLVPALWEAGKMGVRPTQARGSKGGDGTEQRSDIAPPDAAARRKGRTRNGRRGDDGD